MKYVLRAKRKWFESAIGKRGTTLPYLILEQSEGKIKCYGTPRAADATKFPSTTVAGKWFDESGIGRRDDYECVPANETKETVELTFG